MVWKAFVFYTSNFLAYELYERMLMSIEFICSQNGKGEIEGCWTKRWL